MNELIHLVVFSWLALLVHAQGGVGPRTIDKGDQSNIDTRREVVVRTAADWQKLWQQHSPDRPMPSVDFSKEMVVGVFLGSRPTAGSSSQSSTSSPTRSSRPVPSSAHRATSRGAVSRCRSRA
jgi:hypothetical protein